MSRVYIFNLVVRTIWLVVFWWLKSTENPSIFFPLNLKITNVSNVWFGNWKIHCWAVLSWLKAISRKQYEQPLQQRHTALYRLSQRHIHLNVNVEYVTRDMEQNAPNIIHQINYTKVDRINRYYVGTQLFHVYDCTLTVWVNVRECMHV